MYYRLFGLTLATNEPIPGLTASPPGQPEVQVCLGSLPDWLNENCRAGAELDYVSPYEDETGEAVVRTWKLNRGSHTYLRFSDGVEFVFDREASQLWAAWPKTMCAGDMATYLLGPVMGLLLRLRGWVCLHASAIAAGDCAIALLGQAGAGKSTTAAAFAQIGLPILTDDIVVLADRGETFLVQPGDPRVRLWPASVDALYGFPDALPRLIPTWEKRYLDLCQAGYKFQHEALPLAAIYLLDARLDTAPVVEALSLRDGLIHLVTHSYANALLNRAMRAHEFELLSRLVKNIPMRRVHPHIDVRTVSSLCRAILGDFYQCEALARADHIPEEASYV